MRERADVYKVFVGQPEGKTLGRPKRRWDDNIKTVFQKCDGGIGWFAVAQDRDRWQTVVNAVMNLLISSNEGNFLAS